MTEHTLHEPGICCPVEAPTCPLGCDDGRIDLPASYGGPVDCPIHRPDTYPDGFPGVPIPGTGRWLIPPRPAERG